MYYTVFAFCLKFVTLLINFLIIRDTNIMTTLYYVKHCIGIYHYIQLQVLNYFPFYWPYIPMNFPHRIYFLLLMVYKIVFEYFAAKIQNKIL